MAWAADRDGPWSWLHSTWLCPCVTNFPLSLKKNKTFHCFLLTRINVSPPRNLKYSMFSYSFADPDLGGKCPSLSLSIHVRQRPERSCANLHVSHVAHSHASSLSWNNFKEVEEEGEEPCGWLKSSRFSRRVLLVGKLSVVFRGGQELNASPLLLCSQLSTCSLSSSQRGSPFSRSESFTRSLSLSFSLSLSTQGVFPLHCIGWPSFSLMRLVLSSIVPFCTPPHPFPHRVQYVNEFDLFPLRSTGFTDMVRLGY